MMPLIEIDGRKFIDKKETSRRLIHCAIRSTFNEECAVSVRVVGDSALTLMREYAEKTGKPLTSDLTNWVKPEHAEGVSGMLKSHYNYFKHANQDYDKSIDVTNLSKMNDLSLFLTTVIYNDLFKETSAHIQLYQTIHSQITGYKFYKLDEKKIPENIKISMAEFKNVSRTEMYSIGRLSFLHSPLKDEATADMKALIDVDNQKPYDGAPNKNLFKRKID